MSAVDVLSVLLPPVVVVFRPQGEEGTTKTMLRATPGSAVISEERYMTFLTFLLKREVLRAFTSQNGREDCVD